MNEYLEYISEILSKFGTIKTKFMFGGYGIYLNGTIIGIVADNELYFKTDKNIETTYIKYNSEPFTYKKEQKIIKLNYYKVTDEIIEDSKILEKLINYAYKISKK